MPRNQYLQGWVVYSNGLAHALLEDEEHGLIYPCGGVLYSPMVRRTPMIGMDITFCTTCRRTVNELENQRAESLEQTH